MFKKIFVLLFSTLLLAACSNQNNDSQKQSRSSTKPKTHYQSKKKESQNTSAKPNLKKKYRGLKLMTVPAEFRGTWYRSDAFSKKARKLVITKHLINGSVLYKKVGKFKLNHNSTKQNKEYAGDISLGKYLHKNGQSWLRVTDILGTVDLVYITGNFKGHECLYLAYSSGDIHSAIFKDAKTALKYRKYDFSKVNN